MTEEEGRPRPKSSWERPWTIDEMRKGANEWSLASDAGLLQYLQETSARMITRTHEIQEQVNGLVHEAKLTGVRLNNTFNDFTHLANTQFVENRVYDEDVTLEESPTEQKKEKEKTKEEREAELIPKMVTAVNLGLSVIDTAFEKLDIGAVKQIASGSDTESDSDEDEAASRYRPDPILEAKDPYITRPLPYLIGSQAFAQDDDVGLVDLLSEEEESAAETESESESESEPEPEKHTHQSAASEDDFASDTESDGSDIFGQRKNSSGGSFGENSDVEEITDQKSKPPGTVDFASELASKLGGETVAAGGGGAAADEEQSVTTHKSEKKKKRKEEKTQSKKAAIDEGDLFGPEDEAAEDDLFTKGGLFTTRGGLFDDKSDDEGGLFDEVISKPLGSATKSTLAPTAVIPAPPPAEKETDSAAESEEDEPEPPKTTKSGKKVPAGGISIFGDDADDLFASGPAKSMIPKTESAKTEPKKSAPAKVGGGGLFDDDDDEDLFASLPKSQTSSKPAATSAAKGKASLLFGDDDEEEEEDDLFASLPAPKKVVPKPLGDTDLFSTVPAPVSGHPAAKKQLTNDVAKREENSDDDEDDDDLFSTAKSDVVKQAAKTAEDNSVTKPVSADKKLPPGAVSMFGSAVNPLVAALKANQRKQAPQSDTDESDAWSDNEPSSASHSHRTSPSRSTLSQKPLRPPSGDLLGVDGGSQQKEVSPSPSSSSLFAEEPQVHTEAPARSGQKSKSKAGLFSEDDDEEDLFTAMAPKQVPKQKKSTVLFGSPDSDDGDLFATSKPKKPVGGVSIFGGADVVPKPEQNVQQQPPPKPAPATKATLKKPQKTALSLFDDDEDEDDSDLFAGAPAVNKQAPASAPGKIDEPSRPRTKSKTLFEDESADDLLFAGNKPDTVPDVDLFSASSPLARKPAPPAHAKPGSKVSSAPPSVSGATTVSVSGATTVSVSGSTTVSVPGATMGSTSTDLFAASSPEDESDLFSTAPRKQTLVPVSVSGATLSESSSDRLLGSSPPQHTTASVSPKARKPVGGVSMFGGMDPKSLLKNKSTTNQKTPEQTTTTEAVNQKKPAVLFGSSPEEEDPLFPPKAGGGNSGNVAEKRSALGAAAFNPAAALLPGSVAPSRAAESTPSVGFDQPYNTNTLQSLAKDRARVQSKRRPPSRQARKAASREDGTDGGSTSLAPSSVVNGAGEARVSIFTDQTTSGSNSPTAGHHITESPPQQTDRETHKNNVSSNSPQDMIVESDNDLFSKVNKPVSSSMKQNSTNSDSKVVRSAKNRTRPDDDDDLFATARSSSKKVVPLVDDDDLFADAKTKPKPAIDDDDLFADSSLVGKKEVKPTKAASREDDIFADVTPAKPTADDLDADDIFANPAPKQSSKKTPKVVKDDDLFKDDTDIFSNIPSAKPKEKKVKKKAPSKPLFKDDIDDIFADVASKPKTKKTTSSTKKSTKAAMDAEPVDIFDDPLSALK